MASSLEELLAEDGFRGRTTTPRQLSSSKTKTSKSMPLYPLRDKQHKSRSPPTATNRIKAFRTHSDDVSRYATEGGFLRSTSSNSNGQPRESLFKREAMDARTKKESAENVEGNDSAALQASLENVHEIGTEKSEGFEDIHSNKVRTSDKIETISKSISEKERHKDRLIRLDNMQLSERSRKFNKNILRERASSSTNSIDDHSKRETLCKRSTTTTTSSTGSCKNKRSENEKRQRHVGDIDIEQEFSLPALDEAAIQAVVSILTVYVKKYLKDAGFRDKFRRSCFSSFNFAQVEEDSMESKVIANLAEAIETVERAAQDSATARELKTASLQLSVITGLNSNELKGGFTSGVPNSMLSACAHLYLSIIYKIQKKDRTSAKHILQVFCDVPLQARTRFLSDQWDYLFSPHLSPFKLWYEQVANSLTDAPSRHKKLKLLDKLYNEILDSGTYQFAVYYKDWLTDGIEAPSLPSISILNIPVPRNSQETPLENPSQMASPPGRSSPQPMVSKKLYDAVFGRSSKHGVHEANKGGEIESYSSYEGSSNGSTTAEIKEALTCFSQTVENLYCVNEEEVLSKDVHNEAFHSEGAPIMTAGGVLQFPEMNILMERGINYAIEDSESQHTLKNELTLKRLAKSVFELQLNDSYVNVSICPSEASTHDSLPFQITSSLEGDFTEECLKSHHLYESLGKEYSADADLERNHDYSQERSPFTSIPQDFICPLTGQLLEDPVTLETGQTFERAAIEAWYDKGNKTCPTTGKTLECQTVPVTNFILKRVIDSWKLENSRHLSDFASQSQIVHTSALDGSCHKNETATLVIEELLTCLNEEERITKAKHLISLGGLQCLTRRFGLGELEERARLTALLSCCIEADAACRDQIAVSINKDSLIELINTKNVRSRGDAISLLAKLLCLSRRKYVISFFGSSKSEEIVNTMHAVLVYLQSCPPEKRPLAAVLLFNLDFMVKLGKHSIYKEAAVDAITVALKDSLANERLNKECCKILLHLGGKFSFSRELLTKDWILKKAGFDRAFGEEDNLSDEKNVLWDDDDEEEKETNEEWLEYLSVALVGSGSERKSFLEAVSMCLGSGKLELVKACLITVAWMSSALSSTSDAQLQPSTLSAILPRLRECLDSSEPVEHKVLASICLLNFSKNPWLVSNFLLIQTI